jgi:hypothetical protein
MLEQWARKQGLHLAAIAAQAKIKNRPLRVSLQTEEFLLGALRGPIFC